jgi:tetratricopeptide (TPR) repeat protein
MKLKTLILALLLSINSFASEQLFIKANEAYSNSDYTTAVNLYDSIISSGFESYELYFNLGNCYYQNKDWANAIWHYEKSLQLDKNEKTLENIQLAKLKIIDRIEELPQLFYKRWWDKFISIFNTAVWQYLAIVCIWLVFIIKLLSQFTSIKKGNPSNFLYPLAIVLLFATYESYQENYSKTEAIIFSSSVVVNSAPTDISTNQFSLHSGTKVEITDQIGNWINIKLTNGNSGWIKKSDCKILH